MCGICGFNWEDKNLIRRMSKLIHHRGPDETGYLIDKNISLGIKRLSIIDLKTGKQPIYNEDKNICIVFNGEIYNFKKIREELEKKGHRFYTNTDTEVIIHAYEQYGYNCLNYFNGMFAFAIYDSSKKKLFIARDRIGIKPLYYYHGNDKFIFASEIKAILEDKQIPKNINFNSLDKFIAFRYIYGPISIFTDIKKLLPGHYLVFDLKKKKIETTQYWDIQNLKKENKSEDYLIKKFMELFLDSVKKRLISDVPLGVFLSGGIDSSSIVSAMKRIQPSEEVKTFSVGFEHDFIGNELGIAKEVSEIFNTDHKEVFIKTDIVKELPMMIWHLDEPTADPAAIPNYVLSREAKKEVTVILTGDGADELFFGYDQYKFLYWGSKISFLPQPIISNIIPKIIKYTPTPILNKIYKYSSATGNKIYDRFRNFISEIKTNKAKSFLEIVSVFNELERKKIFDKSYNKHNFQDFYSDVNKNFLNKNKSIVDALSILDIKRYLVDDLLMKPDKMCMAYSIEARVPYLDHRLVNFSFSLLPKYKIRWPGMTKYLMKKAFTKTNLLPKKIAYRKKQTFNIPLDLWIIRDLKEPIEKLLEEEKIKKQKIFDFKQIEKILKNFQQSKLYYGRQLWSLINFQLWYDIFIEGKNPKKIQI